MQQRQSDPQRAGLDWRIDGDVLRVVIDRPEKKNALTHAMYDAFADAIETAETDRSVRAIVVTGVGEVFTAGNDLYDFAAGPPDAGEPPVVRFLRLLATTTVPVVVAVNGLAVGIGVTMLLHCDLVYATSDARFRMPFVNLGLVPEAGSSLLLPQLVGHRRAADLLYTGRWFSAQEAHALGLVNEVVAPADLHRRAAEAVTLVAAQPPSAMRTTKALLRGDATAVLERMDDEARQFQRHLRSAEFAEGFESFRARQAGGRRTAPERA